MELPLQQLIETYGIYAVLALCTIEGDITLLLSGVLANNGVFGHYGFFRVLFYGTLGGMIGDGAGYTIGRFFHENAKDYKFYRMARPHIENLIDKFGNFALIISKYIYGIRVAMCVFYGVGRMPILRFLVLDAISCGLWVFILAGVGYFFSGAVTTIIGDFKQVPVALFFIVITGVVAFYLVERFWLSDKVEEANPETIAKIEEKILAVEGAAEQKLHTIGERLHLTRDTITPEAPSEPPPETKKAARK